MKNYSLGYECVFKTWFSTRGVAGSVDELSADGLAELLLNNL